MAGDFGTNERFGSEASVVGAGVCCFEKERRDDGGRKKSAWWWKFFRKHFFRGLLGFALPDVPGAVFYKPEERAVVSSKKVNGEMWMCAAA